MNQLLKQVLFGLCSLLIFSSRSHAQVLINEISASNYSTILNSDGEYDDWIELYNDGSSSVNLQGYGLSDDSLDRFKFVFPNYTMTPGQRLLVFAADQNITTLADHWETAVTASTTWKYFVGTSQPDTNWRNLSFNDGSWSSGHGGIGFGDGDDATQITTSAKSVMMRKTFFVPDTSDIIKAILNIDYDDGFVAYLNGMEIARANIGAAGDRPVYDALAASSHEANMYGGGRADSFFIDNDHLKMALVQGINVLAVEVHNASATSNDLSSIPFLSFGMLTPGSTFSSTPTWFVAPADEYFNANFKLSSSGESVILSTPGGVTVDSKTFPAMTFDDSYGRSNDGSSSWCVFNTPTPGTSNGSSNCYSGYATAPVFSVAPGFYTNSQWLSLSNITPGGVIRYSTNGNDPTSSSPIYSSPILLNNTKTIRAKVFANGYLPSPTVTNTYFYREDVDLPIFTITTDSLNLWDYNTGIYVKGPNADANYPYKGANFWQDWTKPAAIEYYDKDKIRQFHSNGEIAVYGNYSRAKPQKSLEITLSDRFGEGNFNFPLIPDKAFIDKTDNIVLRNSGTDWNVVHFRDAFMERVMKNTHSGYIGTEPAVMFLNGEYWGVFTIHENHDHHWIDHNYGLKQGDYDYIKEDGSTITVKNGSSADFFSMYNYATTANATTQQFYNDMDSYLNLENFADYIIAETYYNNGDWIGDWTNNIKMWRSPKVDNKWHYLMYDLDFGCGYSGSVNDDRLDIALHPAAFSYTSNLLSAMLDNPTFRKYFINRYADLVNTIFKNSEMDAVMHQFQDSMEHDMVAHKALWGGTISDWHDDIDDMMNFVSRRPSKARDYVESQFNMTSQVNITLNASPSGAGRIQISTIIPASLPWTGVYFNGNPVTVTAIPNPGYTFDHFTINSSNNNNQTFTQNFSSSNNTVTAHFTGSSTSPHITISEFNYNASPTNDDGDWLELHNYGSTDLDITGWIIRDENDFHKYTFPLGTVLPANGYLVVAEDMTKFSAQHPGVFNVIGPLGFNFGNGGDQIRLYNYQDNLYLSFYYQDLAPWPVTPDGGGYTCELLSASGDLNDGNNWFPGCAGGSPGREYSSILGVPVSLSGSTTFCTGNSITLVATAISGYSYQWQRNHVNIPGATSPTLTATQGGTYAVNVSYQGCSSLSDSTVITVVSQGPDPVVTPVFRCGPGSLMLTATSTDTIYWFDAPGGNIISVGDTLNTSFLNATTTYYAQTSLSCPSNQIPVEAGILDFTELPVTQDVSRCGTGSVTLTASDTADIHWYTMPTGGALVGTGPTVIVPFIPNDTIFYVEAGNICPSQRVEVNVNINSSAPPVLGSASRCGDGQVALTASSPDPVIWYDALTGGNQLGTGYTFITPWLTTTTTFFAEANGGCASPRSSVDALINPIPPDPTVTDSGSCGPGYASLYATSTEQIFWFDAPTGGNQVGTGSLFVTPFINVPTTFYVEAGYICRSGRVPVQADIYTPPTVDLGAANVSILSGQTLVLDPGPGFASYSWSTGETTQTIVVGTTDTFTVVVTDLHGCTATDSTMLTVINAVDNPDAVVAWLVYPNPAKDKINVLFETVRSESCIISLTDIQGRVVESRSAKLAGGQNREQLKLTNVSKGFYLLHIEAGTFSKTVKVLVE
ncbi:MAG TPA: CotH kinase family protein [Bacteroidia bacterium]|nr:CotH kinase family protein [Bacteroidia bacterium]HNP97752.1 CotH kinase family protein [Bacteroidia bacterium]